MAGEHDLRAWMSDRPASGADTRSRTSDRPASGADTRSRTSDRRAWGADTIVVLDPGHNGGNAAGSIARQVPAGRGLLKPCNTVGAKTGDGYPEHAFAFDVAERVRAGLEATGIIVVMTRDSDDGVGPCVDERAAIGNAKAADAVVSIHADGHVNPEGYGFHIIYSDPPLNAAQAGPAVRLAHIMRDAMRKAGYADATYLGAEGLSARADLAGLNLSERPAVLVECGNMLNPADAADMRSADGRQRYADAIIEGILCFLRTT